MPLYIVGTRDHALLAYVVKEGHKVVEEGHSYLGRTAMQKISYFLKASSVPMDYSFDMYHYGPFCQQILADLELLISDEVIKDNSERQEKYSRYGPSKMIDELIQLRDEELTPYKDLIRRVVQIFAPMSPNQLELVATLDFFYRKKRASGGDKPLKKVVVADFMNAKPEKFMQDEVEEVYDALAKVGLVGR